MRKKLAFLDTSLDDLRAFPESSRQEIGYQLDRIQQGLNPYDWKPFSTIGLGVREIRTRDADGIYRVMYVAKFEEAVYVLHCFQKKTQTTSQSDIDLAKRRYKELVQVRKNEN
ncbi:type II toxin-antitoxin system RelE/ParE family toxin [Shigella dysenteriae]|uniref:Addiction module toxin RelE n=2 Tax=Shigella TaxID=620 RepID=A0A1S9J9E5_SHIBO|nr:type II toxin-antitoxin system RelE/ParE family toxin [Shigella boydii]EFC6288575.1 type II toxin-antitoxin system RelE/ParE family toxin [Escherichia coli]EGD7150534.1 type II toxin-antitoxin system RelE/ParE family toxin [Shigella dysenteriae]EGE2516933.1 type II toxin-antitoxin system RelE/ParE family toxin [Shigella dysenteriae]EHX4643617.1 type II toxin-antitoxin system RelE/ParE family toxin [Shigella dysenteriae]EHX5638670.1 type II toxin-antitoxin system RelE/ParE family toxin [Shig